MSYLKNSVTPGDVTQMPLRQTGRIDLTSSKDENGNALRVQDHGLFARSELDLGDGDRITRRYQGETPLNRAYFSKANMKIVQNAIRRRIFDLSGGTQVIDEQNQFELRTVMRSIFLDYARHLPTNIPEQIAELNERVIEYCVEHVWSSVQHYLKYLNDISHMPTPIAAPVQVSIKGDKVLGMRPPII